MDEVASAIKTIDVICVDDDDNPCEDLLPVKKQPPADEGGGNITAERLRVLLKAFKPLRNVETLVFLPDSQSSDRRDEANNNIFHISESFGWVMWTLEILNVKPQVISMGDFSDCHSKVGLLSWCILPHLRRSFSAVESLHMHLLLDETEVESRRDFDREQIAGNIVTGLMQMNSLRSLKMSFGTDNLDILLLMVDLADKVVLPHLEQFEFIQLHCFASYFAKFVRSHNATLKKIQLCWVSFHDAAFLPDHGGYRGILAAVQSCQRLEYFSTACITAVGCFLLFPGMIQPNVSKEPNEDGYIEVSVNSKGVGKVVLEGVPMVADGLPRLLRCMEEVELK